MSAMAAPVSRRDAEAIRRRRFAERPLVPEADNRALGPPGDQMADWLRDVSANPSWVRLHEWESLEVGDDLVVEEEERRHRQGLLHDRHRSR